LTIVCSSHTPLSVSNSSSSPNYSCSRDQVYPLIPASSVLHHPHRFSYTIFAQTCLQPHSRPVGEARHWWGRADPLPSQAGREGSPQLFWDHNAGTSNCRVHRKVGWPLRCDAMRCVKIFVSEQSESNNVKHRRPNVFIHNFAFLLLRINNVVFRASILQGSGSVNRTLVTPRQTAAGHAIRGEDDFGIDFRAACTKGAMCYVEAALRALCMFALLSCERTHRGYVPVCMCA
jgi:hypothetical protein